MEYYILAIIHGSMDRPTQSSRYYTTVSALTRLIMSSINAVINTAVV